MLLGDMAPGSVTQAGAGSAEAEGCVSLCPSGKKGQLLVSRSRGGWRSARHPLHHSLNFQAGLASLTCILSGPQASFHPGSHLSNLLLNF